MNLYELTEEMRQLLELLEEDEDQTAIEDTLALVKEDLKDKIQGYGCVIRQLAADKAALAEERQRIQKREKSVENNMNRLRDAVKYAMLITNQPKLKTNLFSFSVSTRQKFVLDVDVNDLPDEFKKVTVEPRLKEIGDAMKQEDRGWGHYEQTETLTVR